MKLFSCLFICFNALRIANSLEVSFISKITASDAATGYWFGSSVAVYDDLLVVGSRNCDINSISSAGCAYVFEYNNVTGSFTELQQLYASNARASDQFGASIAIVDYDILIGTYFGNAAYLFGVASVTSNDTFDQVEELDASGSDWLGRSVAITNDYAVVCDWGDDELGTNAGACHIFIKTEVDDGDDSSEGTEGSVTSYQWDMLQTIRASDGIGFDWFGFSVDISDNNKYIIVGATGTDTSGDFTGSAYMFELDDATGMYTQTSKLLASDASDSDEFGTAVSISSVMIDMDGSTSYYKYVAVVGAPGVNVYAGAVYIFEMNEMNDEGAGWIEVNKLGPISGDASQTFGMSVDIYNNELIAVGASGINIDTGSAYIYYNCQENNGSDSDSTWILTDYITASDGESGDTFGTSVSIFGDLMVVGATGDDEFTGSAYIYFVDIDATMEPSNMPSMTPTGMPLDAMVTSYPTVAPSIVTELPTCLASELTGMPSQAPIPFDEDGDGDSSGGVSLRFDGGLGRIVVYGVMVIVVVVVTVL